MYNLVGYLKDTGQKVIIQTCPTLSHACYFIERNSHRLGSYWLDIEENTIF